MQHMPHMPHNGNLRVLRFEFSKELIDAMRQFVTVHKYDDRKTYKEAWTTWVAHDDIDAMMQSEVARLNNLGYKGDVADKLYKSGRYYFRGATSATPNDANGRRKGSGHADPKPWGVALVAPRKYVLLNHALLVDMDDHIRCGLRRDDAYTPASGFAEFCKLNSDHYNSEVARLSEIMPTGEAVHDKLKKTYKNRYFMIARSSRATD
ncbi:MAG: hypothetical protein EBU92_07050 [Betaproteobacteria bacterium]|nr:hypothetical protein [Betaproteobacteria bacterium]